MEKLLSCMLHYLDKQRFMEDNFMFVNYVKERPKQVGGSDCGMYVCKYMNAILNGIPLHLAVWTPPDDIITFRYCIAWEIFKGKARKIADDGINRRNEGH